MTSGRRKSAPEQTSQAALGATITLSSHSGMRPAGERGGAFAEETRGQQALFVLRTLFILTICVPGVYAALRDRYAALVMYLWFALFRPQDWVWIDITSLHLSLLLGLVLLVPAVISGTFPNVSHPLSLGMIGFLVSSLVSQFSAVRPDIGWTWIDFMVRLILTCLMAITLASTPQRLLGLIAVISGSLAFHAAKAGLVFLIGGGTRFADGLAGAFIDNNGYALGAVMIMPLLLATAQNAQVVYQGPLTPWIRRGFYAAVPLCGFAVIGTYSRGGFVALSAAALVYVLLQRRRVTVISALSFCVGCILLFAPIPQSYLDRLETIRTYDEIGEASALSRPHFWRVGIQMGLAKPLGVGLRQYEVAYDAFDTSHGQFGEGRAVHSSHVQIFAELGVVGAAIWTALFACAVFMCLRVRARSDDERLSPEYRQFLFTVANGLLVSITGFVVGGAFLSLALNDLTWLTFALVAALDRISTQALESDAAIPAPALAQAPLAFRVVDTFAPRGASRA